MLYVKLLVNFSVIATKLMDKIQTPSNIEESMRFSVKGKMKVLTDSIFGQAIFGQECGTVLPPSG